MKIKNSGQICDSWFQLFKRKNRYRSDHLKSFLFLQPVSRSKTLLSVKHKKLTLKLKWTFIFYWQLKSFAPCLDTGHTVEGRGQLDQVEPTKHVKLGVAKVVYVNCQGVTKSIHNKRLTSVLIFRRP